MSQFASAEEVYALVGEFLEEVVQHCEIGPRFESADLLVRVEYSDPDCEFWIDTTKRPPQVTQGALEGGTAQVDLSMPADVGHRFWLGRLNLTLAMARGQVSAKGQLARIMKLLPALKPTYAEYESFLRRRGRDDLLET